MNILITGGAGFIGSEIIMQLSNTKYNIVVMDILSEQIHGKNPKSSYLYSRIKDKCNFIQADICNYNMMKNALRGIDAVIHLAAETGTGQSMYQINRYNEVNIMGTSNLFQAILSEGLSIRKVILASSRAVYGEGKYSCPIHGSVYPTGRNIVNMQKGDFGVYCPNCGARLTLAPTDEESKIIPGSLYAFTKYAQEKMTETMCKALNIDFTIFRLQNVYGAGQSLKNPYTGILSVFSTLMLDNKPVNIFEDGKESRDFIHVKDVAAAVIASLSNVKTNSEIINLGSGIGTSVLDMAIMLKELYHSNSAINITGDFRIGDIAHNIADVSKAKQLIDFNCDISLSDGLAQFASWVSEQEKDHTKYERSLEEMECAGMLIRGRDFQTK